jgi:eukaryotic-like serine/threonine-protein kinase
MERLIQHSPDVPGAQATLLFEQSDTEAYHGHFEKARELSRAAANLLQRDGNQEWAARELALAALRETEIGEFERARSYISQAQKLPHGEDVTTLSALVLAQTGDVHQAEALCRELEKQWPLGTYVQKYWLPLIRAEIDLQQRQPSKAVDDLGVPTPLEIANPGTTPVATLYPAYVRGQAYLALGDSAKAVTEFEKLTNGRGLIVNFPLGALAHLQLARAYNLSGDSAKARQSYQTFLTLWKDADPSLPILKEAQSEYATLQ